MLKTAIFYIFVLTFNFCFSLKAHANLLGNEWTFHYENKNYKFSRKGPEKGHAYLDLKDIVKTFPLKLDVNKEKTDFLLKNINTGHEVWFSTRHFTVISFWGNIDLSAPALYNSQNILVPIDFGDRVLRPLLSSQPPIQENRNTQHKVVDVVIDPGHGGNDFGTQSEHDKLEKDIVLQFSRSLNEELIKRGVQSVLTRNFDSFLTLPERTTLANKMKAKLFLSFHLNYDPTKSIRGFEIFVMSLEPSDEENIKTIQIENQVIPAEELDAVSKSLSFIKAESNLEQSLFWAKSLREEIKKYLPEVRNGIKMAPFYVLWGAEMPSLLVELGYINNKKDLDFYLNDKSRDKLISSLADSLSKNLKSKIQNNNTGGVSSK